MQSAVPTSSSDFLPRIGAALFAPGVSSDLPMTVERRLEESGGVRTKDRFTAGAVYTQRLSDQFNATAGLLWANKPEFLEKDTRAVRATLGVRYKLVSASGS